MGDSPLDWNSRCHYALGLYRKLEPCTPEWLAALIMGLTLWGQIVPQEHRNGDDKYVPANYWGFAPELDRLRTLTAYLIVEGRHDLANPIRELTHCLAATAKDLDEYYPIDNPDREASQQRLSDLIRCQVQDIVTLLNKLHRGIFGVHMNHERPAQGLPVGIGAQGVALVDPKRAIKTDRRSSRAAGIEKLKRELTEHIRAAGDHARTLEQADREPKLLPRPKKSELGKRVGLGPWEVTRCFEDPMGTNLKMLYRVAGDLAAVMRYGR